MERVAFAVHDDGVARVVAPGVADAVVDPVPQLVGRLPFALITPLGTHHHNARHVIAVLPLRTSPCDKVKSLGAFATGTLAT